MPSFYLTPEQESTAAMTLDAAKIAAGNGEKGVIMGQIGESKNKPGEIICVFNFIEHDLAVKIIKLIEKDLVK